MRFFADAMLGRLALWMRILGCDVLYERDISDEEITRQAAEDNRILLTRDTLLLRRAVNRKRGFLVHSDHYPDQLREVVHAFGLDWTKNLLTRCLRCNRVLAPQEKHAVKDRIPEYVFRSQSVFKTCPECGKIYWKATHVDRMVRQLEHMLG